MKLFFQTISFVLVFAFSAKCQQLFLNGARNTGLSNAGLAATFNEALYENLAGIAQTEAPVLQLGFQNRFQLAALSTYSAGLIYPLRQGSASLLLQQFGDSYYHEQLIGLGYSHKIRFVQLGIRLNYIRIQAENQPSAGRVLLELGGIIQLSEKIYYAAYAYNLNAAQLPGEEIHLPVELKTGLAYIAFDKLALYSAFTKRLHSKASFQAGIEYFFHSKVVVRTGVNTAPFSNSFGLGFQSKKVQFNYGYVYSRSPGSIHELSIAYTFKERKSIAHHPDF